MANCDPHYQLFIPNQIMSELLREQFVFVVFFSVSEHANILCKANKSKEISEVSKLANVIKS